MEGQPNSVLVDFRDDHFVVVWRLGGDVADSLEKLPHHKYDPESGVWRVPRSYSCVVALQALAKEHDWVFAPAAVLAKVVVDFRDEHFVVVWPGAGPVAEQLQALPQHRFDSQTGVWTIPRHYDSVLALITLARGHGWTLAPAAVAAKNALQEERDAAEFSVQLVFGPSDERIFKVRVDDEELAARVRAVTGAEPDDGPRTFLVPAESLKSCEELGAIVQGADTVFAIDPLAQSLLDEPQERPVTATMAPAVDDASPVALHDGDDSDGVDQTLNYETALLDDTEPPLSLPGFEVALRPYQLAGIRYLLAARRAFLADDKGLGKTAQALAAIEVANEYPALILCPPGLTHHWLHEAKHWLPETRSAAVAEDAAQPLPGCDITIVSYDLLHRSSQALKARGFRSIVADESQNIRSERQQKTRAAISVASTVSGLRFCLSAKPLLDHPVDLVTQLRFLGNLDEDFDGEFLFKERYCRPKQDGLQWRYGASRIEELENRLHSLCYCRRTYSEVAPELPSAVRCVYRIPASHSNARTEFEVAELRRLMALRRLAPREATSAALIEERAEQAASVDRLLVGNDGKLNGVSEWMSTFLESSERLAVFVRSESMLDALAKRFNDAVIVHPDLACTMGGKRVTHFDAARAPLHICDLSTVSPATTMAGCRHVAFAELTWDVTAYVPGELLAGRASSEDRATISYLVGGAADEAIARTLERRWLLGAPESRDDLSSCVDELVRGLQVFAMRDSSDKIEQKDGDSLSSW